jgi:hypothetical protein
VARSKREYNKPPPPILPGSVTRPQRYTKNECWDPDIDPRSVSPELVSYSWEVSYTPYTMKTVEKHPTDGKMHIYAITHYQAQVIYRQVVRKVFSSEWGSVNMTGLYGDGTEVWVIPPPSQYSSKVWEGGRKRWRYTQCDLARDVSTQMWTFTAQLFMSTYFLPVKESGGNWVTKVDLGILNEAHTRA